MPRERYKEAHGGHLMCSSSLSLSLLTPLLAQCHTEMEQDRKRERERNGSVLALCHNGCVMMCQIWQKPAHSLLTNTSTDGHLERRGAVSSCGCSPTPSVSPSFLSLSFHSTTQTQHSISALLHKDVIQ